MIPIQLKPSLNYKHPDFIREIPNALSTEQIESLINYAHSENSGIHRRGSKDTNTTASFFTCQVHPLTDELYTILNPLWESYNNITFIEPYEIKKYVEGDLFEYHTDIYINLYKNVDRKMNLIIQLSDSDEYEGGDLKIFGHTCSREKGRSEEHTSELQSH